MGTRGPAVRDCAAARGAYARVRKLTQGPAAQPHERKEISVTPLLARVFDRQGLLPGTEPLSSVQELLFYFLTPWNIFGQDSSTSPQSVTPLPIASSERSLERRLQLKLEDTSKY